jgi:hypothetical protein
MPQPLQTRSTQRIKLKQFSALAKCRTYISPRVAAKSAVAYGINALPFPLPYRLPQSEQVPGDDGQGHFRLPPSGRVIKQP